MSWTQGKFTVILIFDPQTYAYLGTTDRYELNGMFTDNTVALARTAIVDRAGQLP